MVKTLFIILLAVFLLLTTFSLVFADGIYKWVDEKGTIHFSDNPAFTIFENRERRPSDENAIETASKSTIGNRQFSNEEKDIYYRGIKVPFTSGQRATSQSTGSRVQSKSVRRS